MGFNSEEGREGGQYGVTQKKNWEGGGFAFFFLSGLKERKEGSQSKAERSPNQLRDG